MPLRSVNDASFLETVMGWLQASGEVFVVTRYSHAAGSKDYFLIRTAADFRELLGSLPSRTDVIVFRRRQLPIRGIAGSALFERAASELPEGDWWFLVSFDGDNPKAVATEGDKSFAALKTAIEAHAGDQLAIGPDPPFDDADNPDMQSALVPLPDGTLEVGIY